MSDVYVHDLSTLGAEARAALLRRSEADLSGFLDKVKPIIEAVRTEGDSALVRFARDLDKADLSPGSIKASEAEFDAAFDTARPEGASLPVTEAYGTVVDANGDAAPLGTPVEAYVGETLCGMSSIRRYGDEDGFLIIISGTALIPWCTEGAELTFRIGERTANETIVHNLNASGGEEYDAVRLTVDGTFAP